MKTKNCCTNCISYKIGIIRDELDQSIEEYGIDHSHTLKISQKLDELILEYIQNCANAHCIHMEDVMSDHAAFFYYDLRQLIANLSKYVEYGFKKKHRMYICIDKSMYKELLYALHVLKIPNKYITVCSLDECVSHMKQKGIDGLDKKLDTYMQDAIKKGYTGIRWIIDPKFVTKEISVEDFLNWKIDFQKLIKDRNMSLLCIYDYKKSLDYLKEDHQDFIQRIMNVSLSIQSCRKEE